MKFEAARQGHFKDLLRFLISRKEYLVSYLCTSVLNIIEHSSTVLRTKMHIAYVCPA
jgi:hypothetical protein